MIKVRVCASTELLRSEQAERIAQLALVGQAALNTNLTDPCVGNAVATLLQVIAEIGDNLIAELQDQEGKCVA